MQAKDKVQVITASVMEAVFALLSDKLYKVVLYGSYATEVILHRNQILI